MVRFGCEILKTIPGRVSTEVDARLSFDTAGTLARARRLMSLYEAQGISRNRVLIKIAATWEGIQAAAELEREGIHTNLTLLFSFAQAVACGQAKVQLISPFVGRIYDWYKKTAGTAWDEAANAGANDPGVKSVRAIYNYYKKNDIATEVMGASFRNVGQIVALAGCDLLTISPGLLDQLRQTDGELQRKLNPFDPQPTQEQIYLDEVAFRSMLQADTMATEKLDEGIRGFTKAIETLEAQLAHRLAQLEGGAAFGHAVHEILLLNDLDGDGCITREEWLGSDAVFDALDTDHDGRLLPADVRGGLGATLALSAP